MPYIVFRAAVCSTGPAGVHERARSGPSLFPRPVLSGPGPETTAGSMKPYMCSHTKLVCGVCDDHFDMQGIHKSGFYLGCVMCGRSETVCASVQLCVLSACVCLHEREREHGGNWNHPTVPRRCQHKLELGCYCGA